MEILYEIVKIGIFSCFTLSVAYIILWLLIAIYICIEEQYNKYKKGQKK